MTPTELAITKVLCTAYAALRGPRSVQGVSARNWLTPSHRERPKHASDQAQKRGRTCRPVAGRPIGVGPAARAGSPPRVACHELGKMILIQG
jgi:hypothetical protein